MDKQNLMPQAAQPVNRITTGQLPESLATVGRSPARAWHSCRCWRWGVWAVRVVVFGVFL